MNAAHKPALKLVPKAPAAEPSPKLEPVPGTASRPAAKAAGRSWGDLAAIAISLALPAAITLWGASYYLAPLGVRLRHPLHALLKPAGTVGLALGILGFALFLFMWLYPFRKAVKWLAWTGPLGGWMRVHVVAGLALPAIVAVHAGWRFDGLIGLGYISMFVVSLSGIVGRYLYTHIPRSRNGLELSMEEVANERRALITHLAAATGLVPAEIERRLAVDPRPYDGLDPVRTLVRMVQDDMQRWRVLGELKRELSRPRTGQAPLKGNELRDTLRLARQEMKLTQQVRMLDATRRVFGYWHVAHRPFAITALIAVLVHVIVAIWIGGIHFS
ncbi:MAG: hypothetical protein U0704_11625 [Candidatus Eisenbacteria bacterium]